MFPLVKDYSLSELVSPINITASNPLDSAVINSEQSQRNCGTVRSAARSSMPPAIPANSTIDVIIRPKPSRFLNMIEPLSITIVIENVNDTAAGIFSFDDWFSLFFIVGMESSPAGFSVKGVGHCEGIFHVVSQLQCGNDTRIFALVPNRIVTVCNKTRLCDVIT